MRIKTKSVAFKIVAYSTVCIMLVGIISNLYIYVYLQKKIVEKADAIDALYLQTITTQIDQRLGNAYDLAIVCANDLDVIQAMRLKDMNTHSRKRACVDAQQTLNNYRLSSNVSGYINKLAVINDHLLIQAMANNPGFITDHQRILSSSLVEDSRMREFFYNASVIPYGKDILSLLLPVGGSASGGYLYMELDTAIINDVLLPYSGGNTIFVAGEGAVISPRSVPFLPGQPDEMESGGDFTGENGVVYRTNMRGLKSSGLSVYNCVDVGGLSLDNQKMSYTLVVVMLSVLCVSVGILVIMSNYITKPIKRLINRIKKISENDFSYDPTIEESQDEIGEIGRVVNEMMLSINNLLNETAEMHEQRKNIEIALLQSQVNPHFLYNTLDSIHWMAVIHKNPGIQSITRALSNLLRNIAKGTQDKITLEEELALLNDYVAIQSIRYMETFEFVCKAPSELFRYRIIKLTLQPLVENAIFHGIEPTGRFGTITLDGREEDGDLLLWVEDNGVGIEPERLSGLLTGASGKAKGSMNGIGMVNVHTRLRMLYGSKYGLTVQSVPGEFTRVTVRLPKEE